MQDELELNDLMPEPAEEWRRMLRFVGWGTDDRSSVARTTEALLRRGHELVVDVHA